MALMTERRPVGGIVIVKRDAWIPEDLHDKMRQWNPKSGLGQAVKDMLAMLPYDGRYDLIEKANELLMRITQSVLIESSLGVKVLRHPFSPLLIGRNFVEDYGVVSRKVITTTGVERLVDRFQSSGTYLSFYWHAIGLSSVAEAVGNTALTNEMTTAGYGAIARTSGTLSTGAAGPHVFETVGTVTIDAVTSGTPMVIQEHGLFATSSVGSTGLWDRSLTGTQTLSTGDSLAVTYSLSITAGG